MATIHKGRESAPGPGVTRRRGLDRRAPSMRTAVLFAVLAGVAHGFAPRTSPSTHRARGVVALRAEGSVARCEEKIRAAISPTSLAITNKDDDPNGTHIANVLFGWDVEDEVVEGLAKDSTD